MNGGIGGAGRGVRGTWSMLFSSRVYSSRTSCSRGERVCAIVGCAAEGWYYQDWVGYLIGKYC